MKQVAVLAALTLSAAALAGFSGTDNGPRVRSLKVLAYGDLLSVGERQEMSSVASSMGLGLELATAATNETAALSAKVWDVVVVGREYRIEGNLRMNDIWKFAPRSERVLVDAPVGSGEYAKVHRRTADQAAGRGFRLIPTATAAQLNGGSCDYLTALTWVAKLFGADVMRCGYVPDGMPEATAHAIRRRVMSAVRCEPVPEKLGGMPLPPSVARGIRRLRIVGVEDGEIAELDYHPQQGLRVGFILRPTPVSHIRCELRLADPEKWDGRFWGCGAGGWAGLVGCPSSPTTATLACDLGTSRSPIEINPADIEICRDFGWRATHFATVAAKKMIKTYYPDRALKYSYFTGASTGGGQGLCEAQRYPEDYDGIVSQVPGNDRLARVTPMIQRDKLVKKHGGKWFTNDEQKAIREAELAFFAKTDPAWAHGQFIVDPRPTPEKLDGCWREIVARNPALADREALWRDLFEPVVIRGRRLEPGQMLGAEFNFPWAFVPAKYLGPRKPGEMSDDEVLAFADNENHQFVNPDLSAFKARGGKLIVYAGLEDTSVPALPVNEYYDAVVEKMGGLEKTQDFFRHFLEPGRDHAGEVKTGWPDCRQMIIDWVEKGKAPAALVFPWKAKNLQLRVTPYPEHAVTCEPLGGSELKVHSEI